MNEQNTYKFFVSLYCFFVCWWFILVSCFLFSWFFFLFFLFFPRRSVPLIVACLFLFFLFTSFNSSIFPCPSRRCRVVMLKTVVYGNQVRFESLKNSAGSSNKSELCYIVTYADSHLHTCTYICRIIHNDTTTKTDAWRKTPEDFFNNILPITLFVRFEKGYSRFACERVLETEHKLHILTPLLWPSRCVFLVLLMLGSTPSGGGGPRSPSVGCGLPYHIWSLAVWNSTGHCFGTPNSTQLYNNSTPTRSLTGSLKSNV